jgi:hypothetical protein
MQFYKKNGDFQSELLGYYEFDTLKNNINNVLN